MEHHLVRVVCFQLLYQIINHAKAVIIVHYLRDQPLLDAKVAVIDVGYICHALRQEVDFLVLLFLHEDQLISHVAYHQPQNEDFSDPHICIVVCYHSNSRLIVHLPKHIPSHGQEGGKGGLSLSVHHRKQQHIEQIKINLGKILAVCGTVIQHEKRNK